MLFFKITQKSLNIWARFVGNFVTINFKNLVTLVVRSNLTGACILLQKRFPSKLKFARQKSIEIEIGKVGQFFSVLVVRTWTAVIHELEPDVHGEEEDPRAPENIVWRYQISSFQCKIKDNYYSPLSLRDSNAWPYLWLWTLHPKPFFISQRS